MLSPQLEKVIRSFFAKFSLEDEFEAIYKVSTVIKLKKGQCWIEQGSSVKEVGLLLKGAMKKVFILPEGKEVVKGFSLENEYIGTYSSLLTSQPSIFSIIALEDSIIFNIPYAELRKRFDTNFKWQAVARSIAEELYMVSEVRELELLANQSQQLLKNLIANRTELLGRVSSKDLASYLGIHPVSLSRLRANMNRKKNITKK